MIKTQLSTRRQLELMQQLQELADERAESETRVAETLRTELADTQADYNSTAQRHSKDFSTRRRSLENEFAEAKTTAREQLRKALEELQVRYEQQRNRAEAARKQLVLEIERKKKESEWQALAVFDASKDKPQKMLDQAGKRIHSRHLQVEGLHRDAKTLLAMRRMSKAADAVEASSDYQGEAEDQQAEDRQQAALHQLHDAVLELQAQRLPSLMLEGSRYLGWWAFACVVALVPTLLLVSGPTWLFPLVALLVGSIVTSTAYFVLGKKARQLSLDQFAKITALIGRARDLEQAARDEARTLSQQEADEISQKKNDEVAATQAIRDQAMEQVENETSTALERLQIELDTARLKLEDECDQAITAANEKYPPKLDLLATERRTGLSENETRCAERTTTAQQTHQNDWQTLAERWRLGFQAVRDELSAMREACKRYFPDWSNFAWHDWHRPEQPPPAMQFGTCRLPIAVVKNALSADTRLRPEETHLDLPALMTFAEQPRLVVTASGVGRAAAVEVLQAQMLRFLMAMPAGKLRFTIIDPTALGENFANFMHLADYDEQLIGGRIWTDARHIDERLALLSDHMEKVLQKYLRNEFESIEDYNQHAGEVSEPYHVLVVANFPTGLSDASIRRLTTIATTGPRCGVYTLLSVDGSVKLPNDFSLDEILTDAVQLEWAGDRLKWRYPLYEKLALEIDRLPPREKLNELFREAGQESREASRVEVPFHVVAPQEGTMWSGSTEHELIVPVGRAGANELQSLRLGRGTAQHALISGKTGSGKSTLMHALITNLALHYSPREVEFYLVDFKKGVEFKAYATGQLPHARVIAIESEREFGVSVLQRLDEELRRRGERFRELGVQDLAGIRGACDDRMPRVLLIVDEFQELFVADDKLAQEAALMLDRLVRQGRAFGIHVLLGSQTLAGAYSLARSTIGQMAVRIALECSEADAHLILSDENMAARLLSRPGEAIYNDQNGLVEGNSLFQVVWLADAERQRYLADIREAHLTDESRGATQQMAPTIVFEGNVPADPRDNDSLSELIEQRDSGPVAEPTIWVGSAVRIEPPTHLTLRRQRGNHLLVVGQQEPLALGILATSVVALTAQQRGTDVSFTVLDGQRPESTEKGAWTELASALPCGIEVIDPRGASRAIAALADEVSRRGEAAEEKHPPHFLIVHDLAQFRDLRQTEDEFSFGSSHSDNGDSKNPIDKQFRALLREGPAVGVHVLLWCDSYNSLTRFIDRLTLRELDFRVALQMSSTDSTSLIDSPTASGLGVHRAILYRDDLGTQVKFRPYHRPTAEWLAWVAEQLSGKKLARS